MNKTLNDYKNEFLNLKIEIIPKENSFGEFIHFKSKYKIYFNDNKEEIKRDFITKEDNVKKIKIIIIDHKITSLSRLFYDCKCIKKINFIKFKRDDIKDMSYMFFLCSSLKELNLSNFNTNNVTNMSFMFDRCSLLKELKLSNFNTKKVTDMYSLV